MNNKNRMKDIRAGYGSPPSANNSSRKNRDQSSSLGRMQQQLDIIKSSAASNANSQFTSEDWSMRDTNTTKGLHISQDESITTKVIEITAVSPTSLSSGGRISSDTQRRQQQQSSVVFVENLIDLTSFDSTQAAQQRRRNNNNSSVQTLASSSRFVSSHSTRVFDRSPNNNNNNNRKSSNVLFLSNNRSNDEDDDRDDDALQEGSEEEDEETNVRNDDETNNKNQSHNVDHLYYPSMDNDYPAYPFEHDVTKSRSPRADNNPQVISVQSQDESMSLHFTRNDRYNNNNNAGEQQKQHHVVDILDVDDILDDDIEDDDNENDDDYELSTRGLVSSLPVTSLWDHRDSALLSKLDIIPEPFPMIGMISRTSSMQTSVAVVMPPRGSDRNIRKETIHGDDIESMHDAYGTTTNHGSKQRSSSSGNAFDFDMYPLEPSNGSNGHTTNIVSMMGDSTVTDSIHFRQHHVSTITTSTDEIFAPHFHHHDPNNDVIFLRNNYSFSTTDNNNNNDNRNLDRSNSDNNADGDIMMINRNESQGSSTMAVSANIRRPIQYSFSNATNSAIIHLDDKSIGIDSIGVLEAIEQAVNADASLAGFSAVDTAILDRLTTIYSDYDSAGRGDHSSNGELHHEQVFGRHRSTTSDDDMISQMATTKSTIKTSSSSLPKTVSFDLKETTRVRNNESSLGGTTENEIIIVDDNSTSCLSPLNNVNNKSSPKNNRSVIEPINEIHDYEAEYDRRHQANNLLFGSSKDPRSEVSSGTPSNKSEKNDSKWIPKVDKVGKERNSRIITDTSTSKFDQGRQPQSDSLSRGGSRLEPRSTTKSRLRIQHDRSRSYSPYRKSKVANNHTQNYNASRPSTTTHRRSSHLRSSELNDESSASQETPSLMITNVESLDATNTEDFEDESKIVTHWDRRGTEHDPLEIISVTSALLELPSFTQKSTEKVISDINGLTVTTVRHKMDIESRDDQDKKREINVQKSQPKNQDLVDAETCYMELQKGKPVSQNTAPSNDVLSASASQSESDNQIEDIVHINDSFERRFYSPKNDDVESFSGQQPLTDEYTMALQMRSDPEPTPDDDFDSRNIYDGSDDRVSKSPSPFDAEARYRVIKKQQQDETRNATSRTVYESPSPEVNTKEQQNNHGEHNEVSLEKYVMALQDVRDQILETLTEENDEAAENRYTSVSPESLEIDAGTDTERDSLFIQSTLNPVVRENKSSESSSMQDTTTSVHFSFTINDEFEQAANNVKADLAQKEHVREKMDDDYRGDPPEATTLPARTNEPETSGIEITPVSEFIDVSMHSNPVSPTSLGNEASNDETKSVSVVSQNVSVTVTEATTGSKINEGGNGYEAHVKASANTSTIELIAHAAAELARRHKKVAERHVINLQPVAKVPEHRDTNIQPVAKVTKRYVTNIQPLMATASGKPETFRDMTDQTTDLDTNMESRKESQQKSDDNESSHLQVNVLMTDLAKIPDDRSTKSLQETRSLHSDKSSEEDTALHIAMNDDSAPDVGPDNSLPEHIQFLESSENLATDGRENIDDSVSCKSDPEDTNELQDATKDTISRETPKTNVNQSQFSDAIQYHVDSCAEDVREVRDNTVDGNVEKNPTNSKSESTINISNQKKLHSSKPTHSPKHKSKKKLKQADSHDYRLYQSGTATNTGQPVGSSDSQESGNHANSKDTISRSDISENNEDATDNSETKLSLVDTLSTESDLEDEKEVFDKCSVPYAFHLLDKTCAWLESEDSCCGYKARPSLLTKVKQWEVDRRKPKNNQQKNDHFSSGAPTTVRQVKQDRNYNDKIQPKAKETSHDVQEASVPDTERSSSILESHVEVKKVSPFARPRRPQKAIPQKQDKKVKSSTVELQGRLQKRLMSLLDSEASRSFSPTPTNSNALRKYLIERNKKDQNDIDPVESVSDSSGVVVTSANNKSSLEMSSLNVSQIETRQTQMNLESEFFGHQNLGENGDIKSTSSKNTIIFKERKNPVLMEQIPSMVSFQPDLHETNTATVSAANELAHIVLSNVTSSDRITTVYSEPIRADKVNDEQHFVYPDFRDDSFSTQRSRISPPVSVESESRIDPPSSVMTSPVPTGMPGFVNVVTSPVPTGMPGFVNSILSNDELSVLGSKKAYDNSILNKSNSPTKKEDRHDFVTISRQTVSTSKDDEGINSVISNDSIKTDQINAIIASIREHQKGINQALQSNLEIRGDPIAPLSPAVSLSPMSKMSIATPVHPDTVLLSPSEQEENREQLEDLQLPTLPREETHKPLKLPPSTKLGNTDFDSTSGMRSPRNAQEEERVTALELAEKLRRRAATLKQRRRNRLRRSPITSSPELKNSPIAASGDMLESSSP